MSTSLRSRRSVWPQFLIAAALMAPPLVIFWAWNRFADAQKAKNVIGAWMISTTVQEHLWNFGTWGQLFSLGTAVALLSACLDSVGSIVVPAAIVVIVILYYREFDRETLGLRNAAFTAFLLPFAVFTNLYFQHNYYVTENAVFLIFAVSVVIGRLYTKARYTAAWGLLVVTVLSQLLRFYGFFAKDIANPYYRELLPLAQSVKTNTAPDSVILIYGQEWSPVIPYYSERRAVMEPEWIPLPDMVASLRRVPTPVGGHPVEAIVHCRSPWDNQIEYARMFAAFDIAFRKQHMGGCDVYFTGSAPK